MEQKHAWYIAGGAGFVGSHLVEQVLQDPRTSHVCIIDNYSTGSLENLKKVLKDGRVHLARWDFANEGFYPGVLRHIGLVYFANCLSPMSSDVTEATSMANAYTRMISGLDQTRVNIAASLFISGTDVYPHNAPTPTTEEWGISHRGFYDWYAEKCQHELGLYVCPALTVRPCLLMGPRMLYNDIGSSRVSSIIHDVISTSVVHIQGHGYQKYSLMDVRDAIKIIYKMLMQTKWREKRSLLTGTVEVNVSGNIVMSEAALAEAIASETAGKPIFRCTSYEARSRFRVLDNSLMDELLCGDWRHKYSLQESIRACLQDYAYQASIGHA